MHGPSSALQCLRAAELFRVQSLAWATQETQGHVCPTQMSSVADPDSCSPEVEGRVTCSGWALCGSCSAEHL